MAALGSEDWCNPSHGGVFSDGRPSVHGVAPSPTAPASSRGSPGFPYVTQDLARVGWRGLAPFLPIGPRERPRLADSFLAPGSGARGIPRVARPAIRRVAAMRGKERGPRGTPPSGPLRGGKGIAGSPRAPQFTVCLARRRCQRERRRSASCLFVLGVTRPIMHAAAYSLSVRTTPRDPARCGDDDRRARRSSARAVSSAVLLVCLRAPR